jgi:hypothetical protein
MSQFLSRLPARMPLTKLYKRVGNTAHEYRGSFPGFFTFPAGNSYKILVASLAGNLTLNFLDYTLGGKIPR